MILKFISRKMLNYFSFILFFKSWFLFIFQNWKPKTSASIWRRTTCRGRAWSQIWGKKYIIFNQKALSISVCIIINFLFLNFFRPTMSSCFLLLLPFAWQLWWRPSQASVFIPKMTEFTLFILRFTRKVMTQVNKRLRYRVNRYLSRFFDRWAHETTYACIGNKHFFTKSCHRQTYQNSKISWQKMPISDFQSEFSMSKIIRIFLNFFFFIEEYQFRGTFVFW